MILSCDKHYSRQAMEICSNCFKNYCEDCVVTKGKKVICEECRKTKRYQNIAVVAVFMVFFVGVFVFLFLSSSTFQNQKRAWFLGFELKHDPCNAEKVNEIVGIYADLHKNNKALNYTETFLKNCEEIFDIRRQQFAIHKYTKNYDAALKDVDVFLEEEPYDRDFWAWKGQVYEDMGKYDLAIQHYREAIKLEPELTHLPLNLVDLYRKTKRYCEAYQELERYSLIYPEIRDESKIRYMFADLSKPGRCEKSFSEGDATIEFSPGSKTIRAVVRFNDAVNGTFVIDTGAYNVMLNKSFSEKINLAGEKQSAIFSTANGLTTGYLSKVNKIALKGISSSDVPVIISEGDLPSADGLLGMSFLSRFQIEIDTQKGIMKLKHKAFSGKI